MSDVTRLLGSAAAGDPSAAAAPPDSPIRFTSASVNGAAGGDFA